jgi:hypothetical protein
MTLALNTLLDLLATKAPPLKHRVPTSVLTGRTSELTSYDNNNNYDNDNNDNDNNDNNKHAYAYTNDCFYTSKSPIDTPSTAALWPNLASVADGQSCSSLR